MKALFVMTPEWGGYMPTLPLAKGLRNRGHEVYYLGLNPGRAETASRFAAFMEKQGFRLIPLPPQPALPANGLFRRTRHARRTRLLEFDHIESVVRENGVDMALVDPIVSSAASGPLRAGIPVIGIKTNLLSTVNSQVPPFTSDYLPGPDGGSRAAVLWSWFARWFRINVAPIIRRPWLLPRLLLRPERLLGPIARRHGLACSFTEYGYRLRFPHEFYLCPEEFDFLPVTGHRYAGGQIDTQRAEDDAVWARGFTAMPLVFCSLGTNSESYPHHYSAGRRFFKNVVEAFRQRPEYDLLLHTGDLLSVKDLEPLPENVMVRGWVPQLAVLAKSRLMITHGGLGSIKECVHFRVPMVVFPVGFDQPGNAARVVFHRLGLRGDMRRATPKAIRELLDHAMANRSVYLENLERMRGCFTDPRPLENIMDLIEQASRGRAR